jgi:hypothetical protein
MPACQPTMPRSNRHIRTLLRDRRLSMRPAMFQPPPPDLNGLSDRVRRLAALNDPDAMRAEIDDITTALEALA